MDIDEIDILRFTVDLHVGIALHCGGLHSVGSGIGADKDELRVGSQIVCVISIAERRCGLVDLSTKVHKLNNADFLRSNLIIADQRIL